MKVRNFVVSGLVFVGIMATAIIYSITHILPFKIIASLLFVILYGINILFSRRSISDKKFTALLYAALVFAAIADVVIFFNFIGGAVVFAVGHIFYFIAYCRLEKFRLKDLIFVGIVGAGPIIFMAVAPFINFETTVMKIVAFAYAAIIALMAGKSLANFVGCRTPLNGVILAGSLLFLISDFALMLDCFGGIAVGGKICLSTYYPAQFVLALCPLFCGTRENRAA